MFPSRQKNLPTKGTAIAYVHCFGNFFVAQIARSTRSHFGERQHFPKLQLFHVISSKWSL
jgi:hypothetical protein